MGNYYAGMMNATGGSELRHHGILGQKWGVRRFQNADGSLTPDGRKRYNVGKKTTRKYFESIGEPESAEKYSSLSRKDRKVVDKAVKDLRGPNEFWRGNYEVAFNKSIVPAFKKIGIKMTDARLKRGHDALAKTIYKDQDDPILKGSSKEQSENLELKSERSSSKSPKSKISDFYNGRTSGETDSTKVKDLTLRRQMENNIRQNTKLQDNWDFRGKSAREERELSKKFVKTSLKEFEDAAKVGGEVWKKARDADAYRKAESKRWEKVKADADKYMRDVAKIRLKSMGYDVTDKAIDNLVSKDWFKNSLWIQNTLADIGADGVKHTSKADMRFK